MKVKISGFIQARQSSITNALHYSFSAFDDMTQYGYITVMPHEIEIELPEGFDIREKQVDALETEKRRLGAEFTARVTEIDSQIRSLLAIENGAAS
ncbi:hypothetical protein WT01_15800 [Burkholderia cepacia]|uniref:hypothetical protein n=1 Tax=Burkholderia cepacia TaxID=292 RepID=UPI00075B1EA2|nr:hypothetical protein [Burkholderia cepacia]KVL59291.1 hypothetical protein WT01_15800 [Burkholderia cepacia]